MKRFSSVIATIVLSVVTAVSFAADGPAVPKNKQTQLGLYLTPQQAWDMVQRDPSKTLFLDVRTRSEAVYVGMPDGVDGLVPYVEHDPFWSWDDKRNEYKLEPLQNFVPEVRRRLDAKGLIKDDVVIVMCRSGTRSALAANRLAEEGYTKVYSVVDGFEGDTVKSGPDHGKRTANGWKNAGVPWSYKLDKSKMYIDN